MLEKENIKDLFDKIKNFKNRGVSNIRKIVNSILENEPNNYKALNEMRKAFVEEGKFLEGIDYFIEILERNPENVHAQKQLGILCGDMGHAPNAIGLLNEVISKYNDDLPILCELGLAYNKQNNTEGANKCFERVRKTFTRKRIQDSNKERKRTKDELMKASRFAAANALASCFAHQVNTPLFGIKLSIESIEKKIDNPSNVIVLKKIDNIKLCVRKISDLIKHYNRLMKDEHETKERLDIRIVIENALEMFSSQLNNRGIKLLKNGFEECNQKVYGNATKLEQVFINLIANSRDALVNTSSPFIEIDIDSTNKKTVQIKFSDNGEGISEENQEEIFMSLMTTKSNGTGLGLWLCKTIISDMKGTITLDKSNTKGASFIIKLPKS